MNEKELSFFLEGRKTKIMECHRRCSVLIPIVESKGELHILFEVRSDQVSQPGEVCFPGGLIEGREHPRDCAVRETKEETGIPSHAIRILGDFDLLYNYTNTAIFTFVGRISETDFKKARINREEVEELFIVPLSFFMEREPYVYEYRVEPQIGTDFPYDQLEAKEKYDWRVGEYTVPIYNYQGKIIWGITARIMRHFVSEIKQALL